MQINVTNTTIKQDTRFTWFGLSLRPRDANPVKTSTNKLMGYTSSSLDKPEANNKLITKIGGYNNKITSN